MTNLTLQSRHWYGWQMLPGYEGERHVPYFSPVYLTKIVPAKTGNHELQLEFLNVMYAEGVQDFSHRLRILKRGADFLIAEIIDDAEPPRDRVAVISRLEFEWVRRFCPTVWEAYPPEALDPAEQASVTRYLDHVFNTGDN